MIVEFRENYQCAGVLCMKLLSENIHLASLGDYVDERGHYVTNTFVTILYIILHRILSYPT